MLTNIIIFLFLLVLCMLFAGIIFDVWPDLKDWASKRKRRVPEPESRCLCRPTPPHMPQTYAGEGVTKVKEYSREEWASLLAARETERVAAIAREAE